LAVIIQRISKNLYGHVVVKPKGNAPTELRSSQQDISLTGPGGNTTKVPEQDRVAQHSTLPASIHGNDATKERKWNKGGSKPRNPDYPAGELVSEREVASKSV